MGPQQEVKGCVACISDACEPLSPDLLVWVVRPKSLVEVVGIEILVGAEVGLVYVGDHLLGNVWKSLVVVQYQLG